MDRFSDRFKNRSNFIETAVRAFLTRLARDERNARDLEILNRSATRPNREVSDLLAYQAEL
jgi:hypothetical protein